MNPNSCWLNSVDMSTSAVAAQTKEKHENDEFIPGDNIAQFYIYVRRISWLRGLVNEWLANSLRLTLMLVSRVLVRHGGTCSILGCLIWA